MSDCGEVRFLEAPAKVLKLSEAIRKGIPLVQERRNFCGCAIGTAYTYLTGGNLQDDQYRLRKQPHEGGAQVVADMLNIPRPIVLRASAQHLNGSWSREQCANYLESEGY